MKVLAVQFDIAWEDAAANFARVRRLLDDSGVPAGSLVVLPETFTTGFTMNVKTAAEGPDGPSTAFLRDTARCYGSAVLGGVVGRAADGRGRNEAVLCGADGSELARYAKIHPFSYAGETRHYAAGEAIAVAEIAGTILAVFICYDLRFPEVFRAAVRRGAEVFAVLANWPQARQAHWQALLRARAIENQAFIIGVNRCGRDPNAAYAGGSAIIDPRGETLAQAGDVEQVISADLDLEGLRRYRREFPALADMRADYNGHRPP